MALAEKKGERVSRRSEQPVWQDPETGYLRRVLSPPERGMPELPEIALPAKARVRCPASALGFHHQQIWVTQGTLVFEEGPDTHRPERGDCLQLGPPVDCSFFNPLTAPCKHVVALVRRK